MARPSGHWRLATFRFQEWRECSRPNPRQAAQSAAGCIHAPVRAHRFFLAEFGATLDDVVEETLYVLDVDAAFAVAGKVRKELYGVDRPRCASNLIGVSRLAFPAQLIEVTFRAVLK
jgi:enamine deaminase RidA (YjgF/YER057c/UK114 family)